MLGLDRIIYVFIQEYIKGLRKNKIFKKLKSYTKRLCREVMLEGISNQRAYKAYGLKEELWTKRSLYEYVTRLAIG